MSIVSRKDQEMMAFMGLTVNHPSPSAYPVWGRRFSPLRLLLRKYTRDGHFTPDVSAPNVPLKKVLVHYTDTYRQRLSLKRAARARKKQAV